MFRELPSATMEKALSALSMRERAIADNIANVQTPGYGPRRVLFEQALRAAVKHELRSGGALSTGRAVEQVTPHAVQQPPPGARGAAADLEKEMTDLARTNLHHDALARVVAKRFRMLRSAITGGSAQ
jgi:flagellar basal-body rod protein FlgB